MNSEPRIHEERQDGAGGLCDSLLTGGEIHMGWAASGGVEEGGQKQIFKKNLRLKRTKIFIEPMFIRLSQNDETIFFMTL